MRNKIIDGLRQAIAVVQCKMPPARLSTYVECHDCGNVVRLDEKCNECGAHLYAPTLPPTH